MSNVDPTEGTKLLLFYAANPEGLGTLTPLSPALHRPRRPSHAAPPSARPEEAVVPLPPEFVRATAGEERGSGLCPQGPGRQGEPLPLGPRSTPWRREARSAQVSTEGVLIRLSPLTVSRAQVNPIACFSLPVHHAWLQIRFHSMLQLLK